MISFLQKILLIFLVSFTSVIYSQSETILKNESQSYFDTYRGNNSISVSIGTAVMNGDYPDAKFGFYGQLGYKRSITPHLNVNFTYNKFNIVYKDLYNNGFMSFDLNIEALLMPNNAFSPYIFAGGGLNASNYFKQSDMKTQVGFGIEYIVTEGVGIKLFSDYNNVYSDLVDGREFGETDDVYWRIGLGINYYFRDVRKKKDINGPSIIKSNPIIHNN